MWVVSFPSFLLGLASMAAVRNWASLTTNRSLLSNLLRLYVFAFFLVFIFTLWLTCATFLTFKEVDDWSVSRDTVMCAETTSNMHESAALSAADP